VAISLADPIRLYVISCCECRGDFIYRYSPCRQNIIKENNDKSRTAKLRNKHYEQTQLKMNMEKVRRDDFE